MHFVQGACQLQKTAQWTKHSNLII